jgi:hypothetical protein
MRVRASGPRAVVPPDVGRQLGQGDFEQFLAFGSLVLPPKAIVMNVLSAVMQPY